MNVRIEVTGAEEVASAFDSAASTISSKATIVRDRTKSSIRETARANAPVREGELRDSIVETEDGVEATARHAPHVEHGTYKDAPQPFMDPAVDEHEGSFVDGLAVAAGEV